LALLAPPASRKIIIPALLPGLVTALRVAFGLTLLGLLLAGMISATNGLGHELVLNIANVRVNRILGQLMLIIVIAVVPGFLLRALEVHVTSKYQPE
jgi:ABC-type nitrate/sulfonate/bicarbonate transport system permease component